MDNIENRDLSPKAPIEGYPFDEVKDSLCFGWEILSQKEIPNPYDEHHPFSVVYQLVRDKNRAHYEELVKLENHYLDALTELKPFDKVNGILLIPLLLLGLVPGLVYLAFKKQEQKRADLRNHNAYEAMRASTIAGKALLGQ